MPPLIRSLAVCIGAAIFIAACSQADFGMPTPHSAEDLAQPTTSTVSSGVETEPTQTSEDPLLMDVASIDATVEADATQFAATGVSGQAFGVDQSLPLTTAEISFVIDTDNVLQGECTTLRWDVEGIRAVYLDGEGVVGHGSKAVCPSETIEHHLRVLLNDGSVQERTIQLAVRDKSTSVPLQQAAVPVTESVEIQPWSSEWETPTIQEPSDLPVEWPTNRPPEQPANVEAMGVSPNQIRLRWDPVPGATDYVIQADNCYAVTIETSYICGDYEPESDVAFRVLARNEYGDSLPIDIVGSTTQVSTGTSNGEPVQPYPGIIDDNSSIAGITSSCECLEYLARTIWADKRGKYTMVDFPYQILHDEPAMRARGLRPIDEPVKGAVVLFDRNAHLSRSTGSTNADEVAGHGGVIVDNPTFASGFVASSTFTMRSTNWRFEGAKKVPSPPSLSDCDIRDDKITVVWGDPQISYWIKTVPTPMPTPSGTCPRKAEGDANCDTRVDALDYSIWYVEYLRPPSTKRADFNGDGLVNMLDYSIMLEHYNR